MTGRREIVAALTVDLEGVRAKYECLLCRTLEGPVYGEDNVKPFAATIRNDHRARCTASAPQQGGHR
jgi:hypothetical protein